MSAHREITTEFLNDMFLNFGAEEEKLNAEIMVLSERRDFVARKRAAIKVTMAEVEQQPATDDYGVEIEFDAIFDKQEPKSLEEALIEIAEEHDGVFNTYDHKEQLIDAGLLRGAAQVVTHKLYQTLDGSERFEKNVEKGRWRLISDEEDIPF